MGREARELPTASVGEFKSPKNHLTGNKSFSTGEGLAHVPVLNSSCFNKYFGLPSYIENVQSPYVTLAHIKSILENNLNQLPEGSQLTVFISDFKVYVNLTATENCAVIDSILRLFSQHPRGNAVMFSQVFLHPMHCKLPSTVDPNIPTPV